MLLELLLLLLVDGSGSHADSRGLACLHSFWAEVGVFSFLFYKFMCLYECLR